MNTAVIIGRVGRDAEIQEYESGRSRTTFSLAVNRWDIRTASDVTDWFNIEIWDITNDLSGGGKKSRARIAYENINITDETREIIFTNLVDTDMLYGHRNDAEGYGKAIEEIDEYLEQILPLIGENDLLIITADHGCDPTVEGTDHTREYVPVLYYSDRKSVV